MCGVVNATLCSDYDRDDTRAEAGAKWSRMGLAARAESFGADRFWISDGRRSRKVALYLVAGGRGGLRIWHFGFMDRSDQKIQKVRRELNVLSSSALCSV
jgi:hypothetical protein